MAKTAVIGASGYIGSRLLRAYREDHPDCLGTSHSRDGEGLVPFDLRQPNVASLKLMASGHRAVVIASAITSIEGCEAEPEGSAAVNVEGTLELIRQLGDSGIHVIFLSSDQVFDGVRGGYDDDDAPNPTAHYGRHKAIVEREIGRLCEHYTVVRLSKVIGLEKGDGTVLDEIASQLSRGDGCGAAYDLVFSPTIIDDVVAAIRVLQERNIRGLLNVCSPEAWSRYDLAVALAWALGIDPSRVRRVALAELPFKAKRPPNTSMVCTRLARETGFEFLPVAECIRRVAANWS